MADPVLIRIRLNIFMPTSGRPPLISTDEQTRRDYDNFFEGLIGSLYDELRPGLWHVTGLRGYLGIRETGAIEPSTNRHPQTFPQTANSYALHKGYVSLFDLAAPPLEKLVDFSSRWTSFWHHFSPMSIAMEVTREAVAATLVPNEDALKEVGSTKVFFPWVEAWHIGPIPLSAIRRYLLIPYGNSTQYRWLTADDPQHEELTRLAHGEHS